MLKFEKCCACAFIFLQCLNLVAVEKFENSNRNLTQIKDYLWAKNVTLAETHKSAENVNKAAVEKNISDNTEEEEVAANPLNIIDSSLKPINRTGRQLFYNPNYFFLQNNEPESSKCVTPQGLVGACKSFDSCVQTQKHKVQPSAFLGTQQWPPPAQQQTFAHFQQQPEFCTYYDQFAVPLQGICCTEQQNDFPAQTPSADLPNQPEMLGEQIWQGPENTQNLQVSEADLNSYQTEPPVYDNSHNTLDNDSIDEYMHFPWPHKFAIFAGMQKWPPPVPTHPPSIANWPPPLPTHPPNHHYPTHPPANGDSNLHPANTITTRRPADPDMSGTTTLGLPAQCGLKNAAHSDQERIVGGTNASPHEFPWMAVLFMWTKQICGGSLITNHHVLTAAHCVARMTSWDVAVLTVRLGDYNIRTDYEVKHITRRIKRVVRHKGFAYSNLHNDIAILTLNEPVQYTKEIQPICLPTSPAQQSRSYSGQIATVAGWGSLREDGPQPSILQKVNIPIWNNAECAQKYGRSAPGGIIMSMICAGQADKDSCSGDSGGPLIVNDGARYVQVGIVSWGIGCGKGQYPGVYTRVTSLLPWIYKNIM